MEQGSPEWFEVRLGKATASRVSDIVARTKSGWCAGRENYEAELIAERLTGETADGFRSPAMQRGNDLEGQARAAYEFMTDREVAEVGFVEHPNIPMSGASPDGLVNHEGLVEIKCPNTATHLKTLLGGSIPKKYKDQMQWQIACSGRAWCDFVSFDPRLPAKHQLHVTRVERDAELIAELEDQVRIFLGEIDIKIAKLEAL